MHQSCPLVLQSTLTMASSLWMCISTSSCSMRSTRLSLSLTVTSTYCKLFSIYIVKTRWLLLPRIKQYLFITLWTFNHSPSLLSNLMMWKFKCFILSLYGLSITMCSFLSSNHSAHDGSFIFRLTNLLTILRGLTSTGDRPWLLNISHGAVSKIDYCSGHFVCFNGCFSISILDILIILECLLSSCIKILLHFFLLIW